MVTDVWGNYDRWNKVIFDRYFGPGFAQTPVYLDLDNGMIDEIGRNAGFSLDDGQMHQQFLDAVRPTFRLGWGTDFLERHARRARNWQRDVGAAINGDGNEEPPFIALLGFFSYVAYMMQKGGGFSSSNYHDRLYEAVYDEPADPARKARLGVNFRNHIVGFYDSLARWLDFHNQGRLGLSSANPGPFKGRKYIGYPISQSIMGREDRAKLEAFFRTMSLNPGDDRSLEEMIALLGHWIPISGLSRVAINTFYKGEDEKRAVAEIALAELRAWYPKDGPEGSCRIITHNLKIIMDKKTFPQPQISLLPGFIEHGGPRKPQRFKVIKSSQAIFDTTGEELDELTFEEHDPGLWLSRDRVSMSDFLITEVQLERDDGKSQLKWPLSKRLVFEQNDDLSRLVSTDRPTIGKNLSILAHEQEETHVISEIDQAKVEGTRYDQSQNIRGIPLGFILFDDVRLGSAALGAVEGGGRISLEGGVQLPGQRSSWIASPLPKVVFVSPAPSDECRLESAPYGNLENQDRTRLQILDGPGNAKLADLPESMPVGPYKLTLTLRLGSRVLNASKNFAVCSADNALQDTRELIIDGNLVEDSLYPTHLDNQYTGGELKPIPQTDEDDLPPSEFSGGAAEEVVQPEPTPPAIFGEPLPIPEIHLRLEKGHRVIHREHGEGQVIDIDEDLLGITIDFGGSKGPIRVTGGIIKIRPPAIHLQLNIGDRVQHLYGEGQIIDIDGDRVGITIDFGGPKGPIRVTSEIIKILTDEIHLRLKVGDRLRHREFDEGVVIEIDEDRVGVSIRFVQAGRRRVTNGIIMILPPEIHFKVNKGDRVRHDEFGDGEVIDIDGDRVGITIDFGDPHGVKQVVNGIARILPPEIFEGLRIYDRVQHVDGEGTVIGLARDNVYAKIDFGLIGGVKNVTGGVLKILEINHSTLKEGDRVIHTRFGQCEVLEVYTDVKTGKLTVELEFKSGGEIRQVEKRRVSNGLYKKLGPVQTELRMGTLVISEQFGRGQVRAFSGGLVHVAFYGKQGFHWVSPALLKVLNS